VDPRRRLEALERLERFGRVIVTSEFALPGGFERFRLPVAPHELLDLLAFARLAFGEGVSVASEAAILGVPAILTSTRATGYIHRLVRDYKLAFREPDLDAALALAERLLSDPATPEVWRQRREDLLQREIDLVPWIVREIESFDPSRPQQEPVR
jgi:hypothetical protein